jgi:hypothetical protein
MDDGTSPEHFGYHHVLHVGLQISTANSHDFSFLRTKTSKFCICEEQTNTGYFKPVHTITSYYYKVRFNISLPSTLQSLPRYSFLPDFLTKMFYSHSDSVTQNP